MEIKVFVNSLALGSTGGNLPVQWEEALSRIENALRNAYPSATVEVKDWSSCRYLCDGKYNEQIARTAIRAMEYPTG